MASMLGSKTWLMGTQPVVRGATSGVHVIRPAPFACKQRSSATRPILATAKTVPNTVKILIQGRRLPVTDAIRAYVEEKISRAVSKYQASLKKIDVTLSARGGDTGTHGRREQKVDVTIHTIKNGIVRVEDSEDNLYASIDMVCDKVQRKLRKVKERAINKGTWSGRAGPRVDTSEEDFKEYMDNLIVETLNFDADEARALDLAGAESAKPAKLPVEVMRSKVLYLEPTTVEDAIESLESVGHDFYVFRETESDTVQVVYKRESGGYGLLIPVANKE